MEEGTKTEKKGCLSVTIVCIVLIVGLDILAGFVGLRAEASQQDVYIPFIYHSQQMVIIMMMVVFCFCYVTGEAQKSVAARV